jgi:hypothetical protein
MNVSEFQLTMGDSGLQWVHVASGRILPWIGGGDGDTPEQPAELTVPEDVTVLDDDALATLHGSVRAAIDELAAQAETDSDSISSDDVTRAAELAAAFQALDSEVNRRVDEQAGTVQAVRDALADVRSSDPAPDGGDGDEGEPAPVEDPAGDPAPVEDVPVEAVAASGRRAPITVPARPRAGTMNPSVTMADIARNAPAPAAARRPVADLVMTAAADLPGIGGMQINTLDDLVAAVTRRAIAMGITKGQGAPMPVASIQRNYEYVIEDGATLADIEAAFRAQVDPVRTRTGMEALVAAGGWCAPSEIDYSFFDVTGPPSGQIDLPTIGIRRGGLRWPVSLDLAQFFALSGAPASGIGTNATMPWLWTETDDILAATGSPTKACLRPPCPTFEEERLWLLGICVLAGNLTEDAYPELIRHFLSLVTVAHARVMNRRTIALMAADASVVTVTPTMGASSSATTHFLGAVELVATSERARLGMPQNAVLDMPVPFWVRGLLRSDLAKRNGWDDLGVADSWFMSQLDARNIRAQWVEDWQHATGWAAAAGTIGAATAPVAWPSSFTTLMYPPGHFFQGNGMTLNLGVVRDSVLNEANDHTAAWSEEARLVGSRGNRAISISFANMFPEGTTGAQVDQSAASA